MQYLSRSVETAVLELSKLPGIGRILEEPWQP